MNQAASAPVPADFIDLLRCPKSGEALRAVGNELVSTPGTHHYQISAEGIPLFAATPDSEDARIQQQHYDTISTAYINNLAYPHTEEYIAYLDRSLTDVTNKEAIGVAAEICCGSGEAFALYKDAVSRGIGVDISARMLAAARRKHVSGKLVFVQGDATQLPLKDEGFDTIFMLGGIHHVGNRAALFAEIARVLRPGGRFIWREPVSDFWLWRLLRWIIYRASPILDHTTERPLRYVETAPFLTQAGLRLEHWHTMGYLGFCLFMNSDVLYFNRLFRFIPGIRALTRLFVRLDDFLSKLPGMGRSGLIVVGQARKGQYHLNSSSAT
jgi:SAM-dependent methyltransferase